MRKNREIKLSQWFVRKTGNGYTMFGYPERKQGQYIMLTNPKMTGDEFGKIYFDIPYDEYICWIDDADIKRFDPMGFSIVPNHCVEMMVQKLANNYFDWRVLIPREPLK